MKELLNKFIQEFLKKEKKLKEYENIDFFKYKKNEIVPINEQMKKYQDKLLEMYMIIGDLFSWKEYIDNNYDNNKIDNNKIDNVRKYYSSSLQGFIDDFYVINNKLYNLHLDADLESTYIENKEKFKNKLNEEINEIEEQYDKNNNDDIERMYKQITCEYDTIKSHYDNEEYKNLVDNIKNKIKTNEYFNDYNIKDWKEFELKNNKIVKEDIDYKSLKGNEEWSQYQYQDEMKLAEENINNEFVETFRTRLYGAHYNKTFGSITMYKGYNLKIDDNQKYFILNLNSENASHYVAGKIDDTQKKITLFNDEQYNNIINEVLEGNIVVEKNNNTENYAYEIKNFGNNFYKQIGNNCILNSFLALKDNGYDAVYSDELINELFTGDKSVDLFKSLNENKKLKIDINKYSDPNVIQVMSYIRCLNNLSYIDQVKINPLIEKMLSNMEKIHGIKNNYKNLMQKQYGVLKKSDMNLEDCQECQNEINKIYIKRLEKIAMIRLFNISQNNSQNDNGAIYDNIDALIKNYDNQNKNSNFIFVNNNEYKMVLVKQNNKLLIYTNNKQIDENTQKRLKDKFNMEIECHSNCNMDNLIDMAVYKNIIEKKDLNVEKSIVNYKKLIVNNQTRIQESIKEQGVIKFVHNVLLEGRLANEKFESIINDRRGVLERVKNDNKNKSEQLKNMIDLINHKNREYRESYNRLFKLEGYKNLFEYMSSVEKRLKDDNKLIDSYNKFNKNISTLTNKFEHAMNIKYKKEKINEDLNNNILTENINLTKLNESCVAIDNIIKYIDNIETFKKDIDNNKENDKNQVKQKNEKEIIKKVGMMLDFIDGIDENLNTVFTKDYIQNSKQLIINNYDKCIDIYNDIILKLNTYITENYKNEKALNSSRNKININDIKINNKIKNDNSSINNNITNEKSIKEITEITEILNSISERIYEFAYEKEDIEKLTLLCQDISNLIYILNGEEAEKDFNTKLNKHTTGQSKYEFCINEINYLLTVKNKSIYDEIEKDIIFPINMKKYDDWFIKNKTGMEKNDFINKINTINENIFVFQENNQLNSLNKVKDDIIDLTYKLQGKKEKDEFINELNNNTDTNEVYNICINKYKELLRKKLPRVIRKNKDTVWPKHLREQKQSIKTNDNIQKRRR